MLARLKAIAVLVRVRAPSDYLVLAIKAADSWDRKRAYSMLQNAAV